MKRRDVLKILLAAPAATFSWSDAEAMQAASAAKTARAAATAESPVTRRTPPPAVVVDSPVDAYSEASSHCVVKVAMP